MKMTETTRCLRQMAAQGDSGARDILVTRAYNVAIKGAMAMTRDNRLYEREDVEQQVWLYALEAVDQDKGIGDAEGFYRFHILNRIRDWMGSQVRRHAFCSCTKCGHRQAIKSVAKRICRSCGATGSDIESVAIVDRGADWESAVVRPDDLSALVVKEFWRTLTDIQQAVIVDRLNGRERVEIAVRNKIGIGDVGKVVASVTKSYKEYSAS